MNEAVHITATVVRLLEGGRIEPKPQMHPEVRHIFRMAKPYSEKLCDWKTRFAVCTADPVKNDTVVEYLKANIGRSIETGKTAIIFVERKADVESLYEILYRRENEFNPDFDQSRFQNRKEEYGSIGNGLKSLLNSSNSILGKISSVNKQNERETVVNDVRRRQKLVLITTNVCSRGLDLPNIDLVINYQLPEWHNKKACKGLGRHRSDFVYR